MGKVLNEAVASLDASRLRMHVCWGKKYVNVPDKKTFLPGVIDTTSSHVEHPELVKQRLRQYVVALNKAKSKRERENGTAPDDPASKRRAVCTPYAPIMACTDCGFGTAAGANNLSRDLVFKKIGSMCAGAKLLEEELAAEEAANEKGELVVSEASIGA